MSSDIVQVGDEIYIRFQGPPGTPIDYGPKRVGENGRIELLHIGQVVVTNRTVAQIEKEIHSRYVDDYFRFLSVTVQVGSRFFTVGGEVRSPARYPYSSELTLTKAIDAASGLTEFANKKEIEVTRSNGEKKVVDYNKANRSAKHDIPIYPGDRVHVKRSLW